MELFSTVLNTTDVEITEKRSRFIATISHVESESEAFEFIADIKSKYWDARHNVYAFVLENGNIARYSDDNEPHGTAGKPILDVIVGNNLKNVVIVVTRYFGGILLGTGGLVRAYSSAAASAVENSEIYEMRNCISVNIKCEYNQFEIVKKILENFSAETVHTDFSTQVIIKANVEEKYYGEFSEKLVNSLNGRVDMEEIDKFFAPFKKNF